MDTTVIIIGGVIGLAFVIALALYLVRSNLQTKANKDLELEVILIKIPKYTKQEKEELTKEYIQNALGKIENLFMSLAGLKVDKKFLAPRTDVFSLEIVSVNGLINFYAAIPKIYKEFFIQQLQAVYPKIYFEDMRDYNIFQNDSQIAAGHLRFTGDASLPIKTFKQFETDPLESITNSMSKLTENESAAVQYVFRSAPKKWHKRGRKIATEMQSGMTYKKALNKAGGTGEIGRAHV